MDWRLWLQDWWSLASLQYSIALPMSQRLPPPEWIYNLFSPLQLCFSLPLKLLQFHVSKHISFLSLCPELQESDLKPQDQFQANRTLLVFIKHIMKAAFAILSKWLRIANCLQLEDFDNPKRKPLSRIIRRVTKLSISPQEGLKWRDILGTYRDIRSDLLRNRAISTIKGNRTSLKALTRLGQSLAKFIKWL